MQQAKQQKARQQDNSKEEQKQLQRLNHDYNKDELSRASSSVIEENIDHADSEVRSSRVNTAGGARSTKKRTQDEIDDFDADYDNLEVGDIAEGFTPFLSNELFAGLKPSQVTLVDKHMRPLKGHPINDFK